MPTPVRIALDSGSQSARVAIYDNEMRCLKKTEKRSIWIFREEDGRKVMSPVKDIHDTAIQVMNEAAEFMKANDLVPSSMGITNQRETFAAWEEQTDGSFNCYENVISWQGDNGDLFPEDLDWPADWPKDERDQRFSDFIYKKTGLPHTSYFSCSKIYKFVKQECKNLSNTRFGTVDCYLLRLLTGNYLTDTSNAHRTNLVDIKTVKWSTNLLRMWRLTHKNLPEIRPSAGSFGTIFTDKTKPLFTKDGLDTMYAGLKITGVMGDQQASALAHGLSLSSSIKLTLGTGAFLSARINNLEAAREYSQHAKEFSGLAVIEPSATLQITPLISYGFGGSTDGEVIYMCENYVKAAGVGVAIMVRCGILEKAQDFDETAGGPLDAPPNAELDKIVQYVKDGNYSHLSEKAKTLTPEDKRYICRRYMEDVGRQLCHNVTVFEKYYEYDAKVNKTDKSTFDAIYVDGGLIVSNVTRSILVDAWKDRVEFRRDPEMTVLGAAICSGIGDKSIPLQDLPRTIARMIEIQNTDVLH